MTANIVAAHAGTSKMTSEDVVGDLKKVYAALHGLGADKPKKFSEKPRPALTVKQAFKKDEVICMVCGKGGMKSLTRHLNFVHDLKPGAYRKQFGIRSTQALTATSFTESRRTMALERGLADNLAKARLVRAANIQARKSTLPEAR
jgi:predicted transcriptional regulator